jgi:hypothetical protein
MLCNHQNKVRDNLFKSRMRERIILDRKTVNKSILDIYLSAAQKNMFVTEKFLHSLIKERIWGKHQISTDMVVHSIHHKFVNY